MQLVWLHLSGPAQEYLNDFKCCVAALVKYMLKGAYGVHWAGVKKRCARVLINIHIVETWDRYYPRHET